ncbi:hypothetical protein CEXT_474701 [Caerostris extrusa]|uniref:Uncharacterized protein n=1 Tax=Caerostris extrusa TaxID=172846 RepID=A0AAV4T739_CAEEX|nr:hypothetical protein CEXT_474701 [Caerostris extrusa]
MEVGVLPMITSLNYAIGWRSGQNGLSNRPETVAVSVDSATEARSFFEGYYYSEQGVTDAYFYKVSQTNLIIEGQYVIKMECRSGKYVLGG